MNILQCTGHTLTPKEYLAPTVSCPKAENPVLQRAPQIRLSAQEGTCEETKVQRGAVTC